MSQFTRPNECWYSAAELAGLPGLPATKSGVIRRADRDTWPYRQRKGKGGGREYPLKALPAKTREHLLAQAAAALPLPKVDAPRRETSTTAALAAWQRRVMQARLRVCAMVDELMLSRDVSARQAIEALLAAAAEGSLSPEQMEALREANHRQGQRQRKLHRATIYRWLQARGKGPTALAPASRKSVAPPVWLAPLLRLYQVPTKPSVAACLRKWAEHYPDIPKPSLRTAQRHINELPAEIRHYGRMGRNALRAVQPFVRRTTDGLWPMDVVTVDGHAFKAYVRHPFAAQKIRPELTTYVDVATRRAVGFSAWLAESQMAIWAALRDMVLNPECGVPAMHYSDNGAYTGEQHRGVLERIGTTMMFSQPYRAQARGIIERLNSSVWVPLAKEFPTYVNDDADAEAVRKQLKIANGDGHNLMAWEDFVAAARRALEVYNDTPHSGLKGQTPNQAWDKAVAEGWRPTLLEDDDLHDLLPSAARKVNRGWVRLPWGHYFHDRLRHYHGERVTVGIHPTDGQRVWCSDQNGVLICVAERDGNARPYIPSSMLEHARGQREAGKIKRLERKITDARLEGAATYGLPQADVLHAAGEALPDEVPLSLDSSDEDEYAQAQETFERVMLSMRQPRSILEGGDQ